MWGQRGGRFFRGAPRFATPESFDGSFNFCRVMYESTRREAGGQGWWTDYPGSDINFSVRLSELTKTRVSWQPTGEPNHLVIRLTDAELFQCPWVVIEDAGTASFSDIEVERLREYFLKGGFMWHDDFWGTAAWQVWTGEIGRVLPPGEYPVFEIPPDHPIYRTLFQITKVPQVPSIQFWRGTDASSERGSDSARAEFRGIADKKGRLMVVMSHNTDISDTWEREGEEREYFYRFSPDGYAFGINVMMYAMTH